MKILTTSFALLAILSASGVAQAALESRLGGQAVYDSNLNITWLTDAKSAASNTFGVSGINTDGAMNWYVAQNWIGAMNASDYLGFNDWRLPTTGPINGSTFNETFSNAGTTDVGFNISGPGTVYAGSKVSEMAYLFYNDLGNKAQCSILGTCPQAGWGLVNTSPFSNLQSGAYWSGTEYAPNTNLFARIFDFAAGDQGANDKRFLFYAMAVRDGDVASVPLPAAIWLLGSGLLGLVGVARCKCQLA